MPRVFDLVTVFAGEQQGGIFHIRPVSETLRPAVPFQLSQRFCFSGG